MSDLEPLDPALADLFRREPQTIAPDEVKARALARLSVAIPALVPPAAAPIGPTALHTGGVGTKVVALTATAFVVGGLVGALVVTVLRPPPAERVVYLDRPVASVPAPRRPSGISPTTGTPEITSTPPAASVSARPTPSSSLVGALTAERDLLEDARQRLTSGDASGALARLQDHARRFPHGQLAEEREALAIQALVHTGSLDAARSRASRFRARWPNSVFLPAVDTTLQSIP